MFKKGKTRKLVFGIFLLLAGILMLLDNQGIMPLMVPGYVFSWKMLLVALGAIFIFTEKEKTAGIVLAAIGFYFLIPDIWGIHPGEAGLFWPILFVAAGISILLSRI